MAETFLLFSAHKTQTESLTHPRQRGIQWHNTCFSPPCHRTHGKPLLAECMGEMHQEAPSPRKLGKQLNTSSPNMWEVSCWLQLASPYTLGIWLLHPFHAHIFYLDCHLRTHLVSLWIYFCWAVKVSLSSSWMEFTVVTVLVCPEAGGSPVWTVGMVWWNLGLYSTAVCRILLDRILPYKV